MADAVAKEEKALKMLSKLLRAARQAEEDGKYVALSKLITEANKISQALSDTTLKTAEERDGLFLKKPPYKLVHGEIVE